MGELGWLGGREGGGGGWGGVFIPQTDFICRGSGGFDREPLVVLPHRLGGYRIDFVARRGTW